MNSVRLPTACPSCGKALAVRQLDCPACQTAVQGNFQLPLLSRLTPEEQEFVLHFLKASGSLKDLAKEYGLSYPTVRNRLDALIERVRGMEREENETKEEDSGNGSGNE